VKYPYNINVLTQQIALKQLEQNIDTQVAEIQLQRKWVEEQLAAIPLVKHIYPSDANFLLVRVDEPRSVYNQLINEGIIVRDRSKVPGCRDCLRITIGTPEENRRMIAALKEMIGSKPTA
jgi:histidinol-phosphate aminotransferase